MAETVLGYDAEAIVRKYIELRTFVQDETKTFKARMKTYTDAMELLEGAAQALMKKTNQRSLSTDFGTAFPQEHVSYRVTDSEAWHAWVRTTQAWGMYTNHVSSDAISEYIEKTRNAETGETQIPPGITVDGYIKIHFRSS